MPEYTTFRHNATLLASAARTTTGNNQTATQTAQQGIGPFRWASIMLNATAASGSSPTLNVRIQLLLPDDSTWMDFVSFPQLTSTGTRVAIKSFPTAADDSIVTPGSGALTANTEIAVPLGGEWAAHWTIGGSSPSFTFAIFVDFFA
jgi:hypothetical protein